MCGGRCPPYALWPSAQNLVLTDVALHEYLGVLRYHVYNAMGWNAPAMKP